MRSNKIGSVFGMLKRGDGKFLLLKPSYRDGWLLPGGGVDPNEQPSEACIREFMEETNLNISLREMIQISSKIFEHNDDKYDSFTFLYEVTCDDVSLLEIDNDEIIDYKWVDIEEACALMSTSWGKRLRNLGKGIYFEIL